MLDEVLRNMVRRVKLSTDLEGVVVGVLGRPLADVTLWVDFRLRLFEIRFVLGGT